MKKNIRWTNTEITKIARRMLALCPADMVEKIRDQVKTGANTKIRGLYEYFNAAQDVLPANRQKVNNAAPDVASINRAKAVLAKIRSTNQNNYYQPKSVKTVKTPKPKTAAKAAIKVKKLASKIATELTNIDKSLKVMGISAANRSKILNHVVDHK